MYIDIDIYIDLGASEDGAWNTTDLQRSWM